MTRSEFAYSDYQLDRYFTAVNLPYYHRSKSSELGITSRLGLLNTLVRAQLRTIPFENLDLHYTASKSIDLNPQHLFNKFVDANGHRGGYCMENNLFFGYVLRSLGFEIIPVGGRVNRAAVSVEARNGESKAPFRGWYIS